MPRRGNVPHREVLPDPVYNSKLVSKLVNSIMLDGKKGVAQKIVYDAFDIVKEKTGKEPLEVYEQAMENIMPLLEVKARSRRFELPGSYGSKTRKKTDSRSSLADRLCEKQKRKNHERKTCERDP